MGNSSSTTKETQRANERAYIRSLGDRYPLGDAELRKWCWIHDHLSSTTPLPIPSSSLPPLSLLTMWSALYADYNPYNRQTQSSNTTQSNIQSNNNVQNNFDHKVTSSLGNKQYRFAYTSK